MNFFWSGQKMSWLRLLTIQSFVRYNPTWKVYLWIDDKEYTKPKPWATQEEPDNFKYDGKNYLNQIDVETITWTCPLEGITPNQRSDVFKWQLLANRGGFYSDLDILYIRSIEDIFNKSINYSSGISYTNNNAYYANGYFSVGFMFSFGESKSFQKIYEMTNLHQKDEAHLECYQGFGTDLVEKKYGGLFNTFDDFNQCENGKAFNIPMNWFYFNNSYNATKTFAEDNFNDLLEMSYGLHWYGGHPLASEFNNIVSPDNYNNFTSTIGCAIKHYMKK